MAAVEIDPEVAAAKAAAAKESAATWRAKDEALDAAKEAAKEAEARATSSGLVEKAISSGGVKLSKDEFGLLLKAAF